MKVQKITMLINQIRGNEGQGQDPTKILDHKNFKGSLRNKLNETTSNSGDIVSSVDVPNTGNKLDIKA